ncbi:MAG: hypothetical protein OXC05_13025 [Halieaceae bacterium]|nr:hypothetical protein [Halieaceae bacterium]
MLKKGNELAGNNAPRLEMVLNAHISPYIQMCGHSDGIKKLRICGLFGRVAPDVTTQIFEECIMPVRLQFSEAIERCAPGLGSLASARVLSILSVTIEGLIFEKDIELEEGSGPLCMQVDGIDDMLVAFFTAGIISLQFTMKN